jgi:membrane-associated protease RseP (regulator of RpoE activity)
MRSFLSTFAAVVFLSVGTLHAQQPGALGLTMNDNSAGGVSIATVIPNSPAARMGLQAGDRILAINSQPVANSRDVTRIIGGMQAGTRVELTVARGTWQGRLNGALDSAAVVFNPARQFESVSSPVNLAPNDAEYNGFPFNLFDNGSRGVAAAYGGGGY